MHGSAKCTFLFFLQKILNFLFQVKLKYKRFNEIDLFC